jgi:hypothetical protein
MPLPKTWAVGEVLTAADLNDNFSYLNTADASLQTQITTETSTRIGNDNTEIAARAAADTTHDSRLTALEAVKVIRGGVTSAGAVARGSGFSATRNSVGNFTVTFTAAFAAAPAVVAIAEATNWNVSLSSVSASNFVLTVIDRNGVSVDTAFGFIAYGI